MKKVNFKKDLVIPREMLNEFRVSVRVIDKKHWIGLWPIDVGMHKIFEKQFPTLYRNESFRKNYDLAMVYKGRNIKSDLSKLKIDVSKTRTYDGTIINGIPVPWYLLRRMELDYKKFDFVFTPKF